MPLRNASLVLLWLSVSLSCTTQPDTPAPTSQYRTATPGDLQGPWKNRLTGNTSPYLQLHATDPVDWYPWGDAAFEEARRRGVPVFLSIGFYACHWCHVMHDETFKDPAVAAVLNESFVSIKVDREVHPEVDALYMDAVQMLHRQVGWPANVWLTPDREPFFAGTYFPPTDRPGQPGFTGVISQIAQDWAGRPADIQTHAAKTAERLRNRARTPKGSPVPASAADDAQTHLVRAWSRNLAGWGEKQQFPMAPRLQFLLDHGAVHTAPEAHQLVKLQLEAMDRGGIHDHIGGGFHRYAADPLWRIPHFEKMLYDNAQLLRVYAEASVALDTPRFAEVAHGIAQYMLRDLRADSGGFYSSQAANSDGVEGAYYVWQPDEVRAHLSDPEAFLTAYGLTTAGNFEDGKTVLNRGQDAPTLPASRQALLKARQARTPPGTDKKQVVAWNGLAIGALARAGRVLNEPRYITAAKQAAQAVLAHQQASGQLPRILGDAQSAGVLSDYAFVADGLLDLFEASPDPEWLGAAASVGAAMVARFYDPESGALFQSEQSTSLLTRRTDPIEVAEPSGVGRGINALIRLRALGAGSVSQRTIDTALQNNSWVLERDPKTTPSLCTAADRTTQGSREVLLAAPDLSDPRLSDFLSAYNQAIRPHTVLGVVTPQTAAALQGFSAFTGKTPGTSGTRAYICRNGTCRQPTEELAEFTEQLAQP